MCDQTFCYRYEFLDSKLPYPNGEIFSPATNKLVNRNYNYIKCCEDGQLALTLAEPVVGDTGIEPVTPTMSR